MTTLDFFLWKGPQAPPGTPGALHPLQVFAGAPGPLGPYPAYGGPCKVLKVSKNYELLKYLINFMDD